METSFVQAAKLKLLALVGLSRDALHVHVGLTVFVAVILIWRKPVRSLVPLLAVLAVACAGELVDMRDDLASFGYWRWRASLRDVLSTTFWPFVLWLLARLGVFARLGARSDGR